MCKSEIINRHYVGVKGFSSQNLIRVEGVLEEYKNHVSDIVYIKFSAGVKTNQGFKYDTSNAIVLMMNVLDLRAFVYAIKEIVKYKSNDLGYEKITKSSSMKKITLGYLNKESKDVFYINVKDNDSGKKIGIAFNKWDLMAFADSINLFAELEEKMCYQLSRQKSVAYSNQ